MQLHEERRFMREREYTFLNHRAFHIVVLDNDVLLQDFDGVQLVGSLSLRQQDLELIRFRSRIRVVPLEIVKTHLAKAAFAEYH